MEKTKIFLLETSVEEQNRSEYEPNGVYALGIAYLDAVLRNENYEVLIRDYAQFKEEDCLKEVQKNLIKFKPHILGISVMSMTRVSTYKVIKLAKKIDKRIKIILGGMHPTIMYEQLLKNFPIDAVVIGEGEETIKELIPALIHEKDLSKIKGIAFFKNKKVKLNPQRNLICDLDSLPFPSHEQFMSKKRTKICVLSSRGCPNMCSFCCLHLITKRRYRMRSYGNVVDEIQNIVRKFPQINTVEFADDTFTLSEQRVIDFCQEIIKRGIKVKFICSARIKPMSIKMLYWMEKAGFKEIRFGIETGSRKLLDSIHKAITPEDILNTFKICSKFPKIRFVKYLMVGFPGETNETINESIALTKKLQSLVPMDFFSASPLWVYPGTEIYELMKTSSKIDDSFWLSDKPCPYYTLEHTKEELFNMANRIAFETSMGRGKIFLLFFLIKKFIKQPKHQLKRLIRSNFLIPVILNKIKIK